MYGAVSVVELSSNIELTERIETIENILREAVHFD